MRVLIQVYREIVSHKTTEQGVERVYGDWRWRMKATNGRIIGASTEGYTHRSACLRNILTVTGIDWGGLIGKVELDEYARTEWERIEFATGLRPARHP